MTPDQLELIKGLQGYTVKVEYEDYKQILLRISNESRYCSNFELKKLVKLFKAHDVGIMGEDNGKLEIRLSITVLEDKD